MQESFEISNPMITVNIESDFDTTRLRRGIAHLETAVRSDPRNSRYRQILAEAYLAARRFADALALLEPVWRERPEPRVAYLLSYTQFRLGRLREAEGFIAHSKCDTSVGFSRMHELAGRIAMERGEYAQAVNDFGKAMMLKPNEPEAKWHMGMSLVEYAANTADDCAPLFRRALSLLKDLEVAPGKLDQWHETMGRIYIALHHPVEALRHLERSKRSASAEKSMLMGFAYLLQGRHNKAQSFLREAAVNQIVRPQCLAYLEEVAMTPRHLLTKMGLETGASNIPLFLDHEYLGEIFGPGAHEVAFLIQAATHPRADAMDRTRAEVRSDAREYGRLLAPGEPSGEAHSSSSTQAANNDSPASLTKSVTNTDTTAANQGDTLFPQTLLEVRDTDILEKVDVESRQPDKDANESTLSDDDWDIGLDDDFSYTEPDPEVPRTEKFKLEEDRSETDSADDPESID